MSAIERKTLVSMNDSNCVPSVHSIKQRMAFAAAAFFPCANAFIVLPIKMNCYWK